MVDLAVQSTMARRTASKQKSSKSSKNRIIIVVFAGLAAVSILHLLQFPNLSSDVDVDVDVFMKSSRTETTWEPKTQATACNPKRDVAKDLFHSQDREDRKLMEWFGGLCGGTYVEMGGLDGSRYSNSFAFNKGLDWKGVLVEGSPDSFEKLKVNRPNELMALNVGVCGKERMLHYVNKASAAVRGFVEFSAESFAKQWWTPKMIEEALEVQCRTLKNILLEAVGPEFYFDFFSLDLEGAEFEALSSIDFDLVSFGIVFVESDRHNNMKNAAIRTLLESNGYTFLMDWNRSYWFINNDFARIYADFIHSS